MNLRFGIINIRQLVPNRNMLVAGLLCGLLCVIAARLYADVIHLDNHRSLSGVIEEESATHVVIRVGAGRIRLERSRIVAIERADPQKRQALMREWREQHFLEPAFVPPAMRDLASGFRKLLRERQMLRQAVAEFRRLEERERDILNAADRLHRELDEASGKLGSADNGDAHAYNRLVADVNRVASELRANRRELEVMRDAMVARRELLDGYIGRFDDVMQSYREARRRFEGDQDNRDFLDAINERFASLLDEFQEYRIETEQHGSVSVVTVRVNDRVDGRFIVDTGAGVVTISSDFAERLGLASATPGEPLSRVVLADGRSVDARPVILKSLTVAGHTEKSVEAVILEKPPGEEIDGLLGMSFLRRFHVTMTGPGRLVLRRLAPR